MLRRRYLERNNKILDDIFTEWRLLTKGGVPYVNEPYHLVLLERAMNNLNLPSWFDKKWLMKEIRVDEKFFADLIPEGKSGGTAEIDKFIKKFVTKLNSSSIKPKCSVRTKKPINFKSGKNPRVDVTIDCKDIGSGSRQVVFDEVAKFKGKLKTTYTSSNTFSSAGHVETTIDGILVRIEFKGGKKSSKSS